MLIVFGLLIASFTPMAEKPAVKAASLSTSGSKATLLPLPRFLQQCRLEQVGSSVLSFWSWEQRIIQYLASQKLALPEIIQQIFRTQMIDGEGLTGMNKEDLERNGVPAGVASKIMMRIPL